MHGSVTAYKSTGETRGNPTNTTSHFTSGSYSGSKDTPSRLNGLTKQACSLKTSMQNHGSVTIQAHSFEMRINFEPISFSEEHIEYTSVEDEPQNESQSSPASSDALFSLLAFLDALSMMNNAAFCRVCLSRNEKTSKNTIIPEGKKNAFSSYRDDNLKKLPTRPDHGNDRSGWRGFCLGLCDYCGTSFRETLVSMTVLGHSSQPSQARESSKS